MTLPGLSPLFPLEILVKEVAVVVFQRDFGLDGLVQRVSAEPDLALARPGHSGHHPRHCEQRGRGHGQGGSGRRQ